MLLSCWLAFGRARLCGRFLCSEVSPSFNARVAFSISFSCSLRAAVGDRSGIAVGLSFIEISLVVGVAPVADDVNGGGHVASSTATAAISTAKQSTACIQFATATATISTAKQSTACTQSAIATATATAATVVATTAAATAIVTAAGATAIATTAGSDNATTTACSGTTCVRTATAIVADVKAAVVPGFSFHKEKTRFA
jgi:hypothetical protein